jgi:hypothetical protein
MTAPLSRAAVAVLVPLLATGACSLTATIERRDGPPTEGRIDQSDRNTLHLVDGDGRTMALDRRQVADIDHPGNIALTVGAVLTRARRSGERGSRRTRWSAASGWGSRSPGSEAELLAHARSEWTDLVQASFGRLLPAAL